MKEILTSVARTHLALIATSTLMLALVVGPDEARSLDRAAVDVQQLGAIADRFAHSEQASRKYSPRDTARWAKSEVDRVRGILLEYAGVFPMADDVQYRGPLEYSPPTRDSSVNDILLALESPPKRFFSAPQYVTLKYMLDMITGRGSGGSLDCRRNPSRSGDTVPANPWPRGWHYGISMSKIFRGRATPR